MLEKYLLFDLSRIDLVLLTVIPVIINIAFFLYVLIKLPASRLNFVFSAFVLIMAAWQFSSGLMHLSNNQHTAFEWYIVSSIFSIIVVPFGIYFLFFVNGWIKKISEYFILFVLIIPNFISILFISARLDSYSILPSKNWNWVINPNPTLITSIIYTWLSINAIALFVLLWVSYFKASNKHTKQILLILSLGFSVPFFVGFIFEIIYPFLIDKNDIPISAPMATVFSLSALFAVLRYKMLDYSPRHQWDAIVNNMNESLLIVDNDDRIQFVNKKICEEMEYEPHELIGKIGYEVFINENERQNIRNINKQRQNGLSSRYEICMKTKSGKEKWVIIHGSPYTNLSGKVIGSIALMSNIDELKKANLMIENEKRKAESIINSLPGIFYLFDKEGKFLLWNKNFEYVSEYSSDELAVTNPLDFFEENEKPKIRQKIEEVFETGYAEVQTYFINKENIVKPYFFTGYKYEFEGKTHLIGMGIDISEQKNIENKLKVKEEYYRTLVEQAPDAIIINNHDLKIIDINSYGCEMLGYSKKELIGKNISDLITEKNKLDLPINIDLVKKGKLSIVERVLTTKDGNEITVEVRIKQMSDGNYQAFLTDITERNKITEEIKNLNIKLTQKTLILEKSNAELEQFAYVASHDMQEPLRMVSSFMKLLESKYKDIFDDKAKEYIKHAVDGATRMKQVIYDLLEYSKAGRNINDMGMINTNEIIDEILKINKNEINDNQATINYENLPTIFARKTSIQQVFQNLIGNALKYTSNNRKPIINISYEETDTYWKFCISDNGIGIEPKYFDKIFVIFQRVISNNESSGSGIGLAICKKIVELHNGKIWVESEPGTGTSFYFTISKAM